MPEMPQQDAICPRQPAPLFELCEEGMAQLMRHGVVRCCPARTVVIHEHNESGSLYVVLEGSVKIYGSGSSGKEFIFGTMGAGNYFGEMVLDGGPRSASVMTLEDCRFLVVPRQNVDELIEHHPQFARDLIRRLISKVRYLTDTTLNLAYLDVYGRFVHFLNANAVHEDERLFVRDRLTQSEIAASIGGSREMVSRIMAELCAGNYISTSAKRIEIHRRLPAKW